MEFHCYTDWDELPADAEDLFSDAERRSLFFSRRWFETLFGHGLEADQNLAIACVSHAGRVVAIVPLRSDASGNWHALTTFYTSLFSLLLISHDRDAVLTCLADGLAGLPVQSLRLEPVSDDDANIETLSQLMARQGFEVQRLFHFVNWSHRVQGRSFEQYFADRPSRLRNTITRKRRRLARDHDLRIRLFREEPLEQAICDYGRVFKASWKDGERFRQFIPSLLATAAEAGWLRLGLLYIDDEPAAAQIWFVVHHKASIFRLAYDERWKDYSPGSILTAEMMRHAIDHDAVDSIDFLTGNERYKQDWMDKRSERWRVVFTREAGRSRSGHWLGRFFNTRP